MTLLPEVVETERLVLRLWRDDDVDALAVAITESLDHLRPWMPWAGDEPLDRDRRLALFAGWRVSREAGGDAVYGIFRDGDVVGGTGLHHRRGPGVLEIGYWVHADHVRRGYATEVSGALTSVALALAEIEAVEIHHDRANVASGGVPRSLGYTLVAETPKPVDAPGEMGIDCAWRITPSHVGGERRSADRPQRP